MSCLATATSLSARAVAVLPAAHDRRLQQHAGFRNAAAGQRVVDAFQHLLGAYVRKEPEPPAIHAEHRYAAGRGYPRRVQHRAVAADGDHHVGTERESGLGHEFDVERGVVHAAVGHGTHAHALPQQVTGEREHGLADARFGRATRQGDGPVGDGAGAHV